MGGEEGYIDEDGNPLKTIVPSFGSSVILELHKIDGEYAIKVWSHKYTSIKLNMQDILFIADLI